MKLQRVYDAREHDVPYELRTDGFSGATPVRPYVDRDTGLAYFLTEEEATTLRAD